MSDIGSDDVQDAAETAADEFEEIDDETDVTDRQKSFFGWWLKGVGIVIAALVVLGPTLFIAGVHAGVFVVEPFVIGGERISVARYIEWFILAMLAAVTVTTVIAILVKAPGDYLAAGARALAALGGGSDSEE
jgi:hypothetical protein